MMNLAVISAEWLAVRCLPSAAAPADRSDRDQRLAGAASTEADQATAVIRQQASGKGRVLGPAQGRVAGE